MQLQLGVFVLFLLIGWHRLRDEEELVLNDDHYDGGITEQTALTVKNATPSDMGSYKCILENDVASSVSEDTVEVSVFCTYAQQSRMRAVYVY